jgi:hypothetical protein
MSSSIYTFLEGINMSVYKPKKTHMQEIDMDKSKKVFIQAQVTEKERDDLHMVARSHNRNASEQMRHWIKGGIKRLEASQK